MGKRPMRQKSQADCWHNHGFMCVATVNENQFPAHWICKKLCGYSLNYNPAAFVKKRVKKVIQGEEVEVEAWVNEDLVFFKEPMKPLKKIELTNESEITKQRMGKS